MGRRKFTREFKVEAVRLVREQGMTIAQVGRDVDVHATLLGTWVKQYGEDPGDSFPGKGQMKPEQAEVAGLKRAIVKLKAERDILKEATAFFAKEST